VPVHALLLGLLFILYKASGICSERSTDNDQFGKVCQIAKWVRNGIWYSRRCFGSLISASDNNKKEACQNV
jgi:hypothetical protein